MKKKISKNILEKFSKIQLLLLDFDGVLTDNKVYVFQNGKEAVMCDRRDGFGLERLRKLTNVEVVILSKETNPVVKTRAQKLKISCTQGIENKIKNYGLEVKKRNLKDEQVCFIGNDLNDLECIKRAGIGIAVQDAFLPAKKIADFITSKKGGKGAVREVCDLIVFSKGKHPLKK